MKKCWPWNRIREKLPKYMRNMPDGPLRKKVMEAYRSMVRKNETSRINVEHY